MKNIIIAGSGRAGKTTLARKINEELNYFVINLDKLMTAFNRAYPQLDVRIAWDYYKATTNIAPFLGHYLGMLSSGQGFADELNLRAHDVKGNRFVLEGGHFDFEIISSILKDYGTEELKDSFILIGLIQNQTADEFFNNVRKYDTEDDWTHSFDDDDLMELCKNLVSHNLEMSDYFDKYGFITYDSSKNRKLVFDRIISDIKSKWLEENVL
jgi:adenylate kinase family enzyme